MGAAVEIPLFEKQIEFMSATEADVLFDAGIGSGKTMCGTLWLAQCAIDYPGTRWGLIARDANQLRNATQVEFESALKKMGLRQGFHYTRIQSPQLEYTFYNGSVVVGCGAHNYDSAFRGPSWSGFLGDEVDYWKREAFEAALGRVRMWPELTRYVSSPKGYNFVWDYFYNCDPEEKKHRKVINATAYDNPLLSERYITRLRKTYSPKMFEQEVLGKRLNLKVGAVYSEFDREKHVEECRSRIAKDDVIYFFTDYNVAHYCGVYAVFNEFEKKLYIIGEEHLEFGNSRIMAEKICAKFPDNMVIVCGDSTGNNKRDVAIEKTNYQHFRDAGLTTLPFTNPHVESRIISANSNFYHSQVVIDPVCTNTIRDLELTSWLENGSGIDKSDITLSHATDGLTYCMWHFLKVIKRKRSKTIQM